MNSDSLLGSIDLLYESYTDGYRQLRFYEIRLAAASAWSIL
ncbi:hypothetical protein [Paenibacillus hunanensis]|nr:hypothetical protein [Paenibacillus hunanensis]